MHCFVYKKNGTKTGNEEMTDGHISEWKKISFTVSVCMWFKLEGCAVCTEGLWDCEYGMRGR